MSESTHKGEDKILSLLHRALDESDPVPTDVTDFARAAISWRTVDADLAQLSYDSSEESTPIGVRSLSVARMLSFETSAWAIDIEYNTASRLLMGQIEPSREVAVELHLAGGVVATESDELGRFSFDGILPGPIALVFRPSGDEMIKTEWTLL